MCADPLQEPSASKGVLPVGDATLVSPPLPVQVRTAAEADRPAWNAFVYAEPEATFFHRFEWRDVLGRAFGHRSHYLLAERAGRVVGVLPLAEVKSVLFGHSLISTPFCVYGGIVARDAGAFEALEQAACELARRLGVDYLEMRNRAKRHEMMSEVRELSAALNPIETLFVVDSMAGQDAVNAARAFGAALNLTGVVLTKADGDARGGAALSVRQITGQPILFVGTGEKPDALEAFQPDRMASRILGMGDVLSLVEQVTRQVDRDEAEKLARKVASGKDFNLEDLLGQLRQIEQMGGMAALMDKLPSQLAAKAGQMPQGNEKEVKRQIAIICSMTPRERRFPKNIDGSRKRRIASGSGTQVAEINRLLKNFLQMQKMMKGMGKGGLGRMMRSMSGRMPMGRG